VIPKPQKAETLRLKPVRSPSIRFDLLRMLATIKLNDYPGLQADEINNVCANWSLSSESVAVDLTMTKLAPESALSVSHIFSKGPSEVSVHGPIPPP
jgi:hypothetical protein